MPKDGDIKFTVLQTTQDHKLHPVKSTPFSKEGYTEIGYLDLDSACATHPYLGTGVSLTDASCYLLSQMPPRKRKAFLKDAFTPTGMNLSMVRLNCGASDYATELYNYNDVAGDVEMKHFSIDRDRLYMIPVIKEVLKVRPDLFVYSAVWSEPGWMKTSGAMCGGALVDEYLPAYANYVAAYLKAYKDAGVKIDAMSIHNEPLTDQNGGCPASLVSEEQEIMLAGKLFPEAFRKAGVETKIWVHDYDYTYWERVNRILAECLMRRGDRDQSAADYQKAIDIYSNLYAQQALTENDRLLYASCLGRIGQTAEEKKLLQEMADAGSTNYHVYMLLSELALSEGDTEDASKNYDQAAAYLQSANASDPELEQLREKLGK